MTKKKIVYYSPYEIGSTCVTDGIEEISSAQAKRIISDQTMET